MKFIITLLVLSLGAFSYGQDVPPCNINTYKEFIFEEDWVVYKDGQHIKCDFSGENLAHIDFIDAYLYQSKFTDSNCSDVNFYSSSMVYVNYENANCEGAIFESAMIRMSSMRNANLRNASFYGANLYGTIFHGADLRGAIFSWANLYEADFTGAKVDPDLATYLTSQGITGFIVVEVEEGN